MSYRIFVGAALLAAICVPGGNKAVAIPVSQGLSAISQTAGDGGLVEQVAHEGRGGAGRGHVGVAGAHVGSAHVGGANAARRTGNGNVNRPTTVGVGGAWRRPGGYWWRPGGAIAAGAAVGFVSAAAAGAYASSPAPGSNYCWYYTDESRTSGFWDVCP